MEEKLSKRQVRSGQVRSGQARAGAERRNWNRRQGRLASTGVEGALILFTA